MLLDVTDLPAAAPAIARAGEIDILVNNAGYNLHGVVETTSAAAFQALIDTHLLGPVALIQAALPGMRARRSGHILNIGSLAVHTPGAGVGAYAAVKAGIEALSVSLAAEVEPFGIRVTAVSPGGFRTAIGDSRRATDRAIADYAEIDAVRLARMAEVAGRQRGDPVKGAAAILTLVDAPNPPRRFAIGPDAIAGFRQQAAALNQSADDWEAVGGATDFA